MNHNDKALLYRKKIQTLSKDTFLKIVRMKTIENHEKITDIVLNSTNEEEILEELAKI